MRARKAVLGGLIVVMLWGLVACGGGDDDDEKVLGGAGTADLVIKDDKPPFWDPENLTIRLNQEVTFTVFNDAKKLHNITIPALDIDMDVPVGQTVSIKIPAVSEAPRDGFFTIYCKYHQSEGEQGRINISR